MTKLKEQAGAAWVTLGEYAAGPSTFDGDGITTEGVPPEQQEAFDLDRYVCDAHFPVAEKYRSLSPEERSRWYAYLTTA